VKTLRDLWRHRALIGVLTAREMKARYRGSLLGFLWSLLNPLLMLAVYTLVFQVVLPNRAPSTSPYALFLFCGLLPWNWLAAGLTDAASSLVTHGALLKKILFPAEVLPVVAVLAQGVHFLLALPILAGGLALGALGVFGARPVLGWTLLQLPLLLVLQGVILVGLGLFLAGLTVHFRDVRDLLATALTLWFFATPILYDLADVASPRAVRLLSLNPAAPLFAAWRDALFFGRWVPLRTWGLLAAFAVVTFALGQALFDRLRDTYAEAV
jgi:ABC-type polysaccharide/polyol phosphate export permease